MGEGLERKIHDFERFGDERGRVGWERERGKG